MSDRRLFCATKFGSGSDASRGPEGLSLLGCELLLAAEPTTWCICTSFVGPTPKTSPVESVEITCGEPTPDASWGVLGGLVLSTDLLSLWTLFLSVMGPIPVA